MQLMQSTKIIVRADHEEEFNNKSTINNLLCYQFEYNSSSDIKNFRSFNNSNEKIHANIKDSIPS